MRESAMGFSNLFDLGPCLPRGPSRTSLNSRTVPTSLASFPPSRYRRCHTYSVHLRLSAGRLRITNPACSTRKPHGKAFSQVHFVSAGDMLRSEHLSYSLRGAPRGYYRCTCTSHTSWSDKTRAPSSALARGRMGVLICCMPIYVPQSLVQSFGACATKTGNKPPIASKAERWTFVRLIRWRLQGPQHHAVMGDTRSIYGEPGLLDVPPTARLPKYQIMDARILVASRHLLDLPLYR
ncbi:hypothetical protein B0H63DRAFT_194442 [Podospora didyma]|uniref:Uncharacterized protein n=1 Tax=Podospora didyma TaxID=330526 RepID=A0AAE0TVI4_9PEZI|nr:hypothetical protein B0H63DRAFT_194442 [Podospora didyma]